LSDTNTSAPNVPFIARLISATKLATVGAGDVYVTVSVLTHGVVSFTVNWYTALGTKLSSRSLLKLLLIKRLARSLSPAEVSSTITDESVNTPPLFSTTSHSAWFPLANWIILAGPATVF